MLHLRNLLALALLVLLVLPAGAFAADKSITIGGKNFTEQYILPELAKQLLEKNGYEVELRTGVGTSIARQSLETGQIDMYYEYTGTAYTVFYKQNEQAVMSDPQKVYEWVKSHDAEKGLVWLDRVQFNNTYTIMVRKDFAEKHNLKTISDFGAFIEENPDAITFALEAEFWERPDGFKKIMKVYDFRLPVSGIKKMDMGLTYLALKNDQVDAAMGFSTDGRIAAFNLVNLEDDKKFFPVYNPAPVIRQDVLEAHPEIGDILKPIADNLSTSEMQRLNALVDVEHEDVSKVVEEWLTKQGLL